MSDLELFTAHWPNIREEALKRLLGDDSLYDTKSSDLRSWVESKEHARAILLVANSLAESFKMKLRLDGRENTLMNKKFVT